eukprot:Sspe_Gene.118251::Locus_111125_Transcript_1_1_Confidence_1.000_Length_649::g.118251::m.118251
MPRGRGDAVMIALLRAVNVSGKRVVKMEDLRGHLEDKGLQGVETYIQSGNIVFRTPLSTSDAQRIIADTIAEEFGYDDVDVFVQKASELAEVAKKGVEVAGGEDDLHLTVLLRAPPKGVPLPPGAHTVDGVRHVVRIPDYEARKEYTKALNKLHIPSTTRNWRTIAQLLRMSERL